MARTNDENERKRNGWDCTLFIPGFTFACKSPGKVLVLAEVEEEEE